MRLLHRTRLKTRVNGLGIRDLDGEAHAWTAPMPLLPTTSSLKVSGDANCTMVAPGWTPSDRPDKRCSTIFDFGTCHGFENVGDCTEVVGS